LLREKEKKTEERNHHTLRRMRWGGRLESQNDRPNGNEWEEGAKLRGEIEDEKV